MTEQNEDYFNPEEAIGAFASLLLMVGMLVGLAALGYTLIHWGDYRHDLKGLAIYYGLPLTGVLVCAGALRLPPNRRMQFAMAAGSFGVAIYLAEYVLFSVKTKSAQERWENRHELIDDGTADYRSKREVIGDLRKTGVRAYPAVYPKLFWQDGIEVNGQRIRPLNGVANVPTVYCNTEREAGDYVVYDSDEFGFRNPPGSFGSNQVEVVYVGDSFVQGHCVDCGENLASVTREHGIASIGLGQGGNGPLTELATLLEYAEPLTPRHVVWVFYEGNDLFNIDDELKTPLMDYLKPGHRLGLAAMQTEVDHAIRAYVDALLEEGEAPKAEQVGTEKRDTVEGTIVAAADDDTPSPLSMMLKLTHLREALGLVSGTPMHADILTQALSTAREAVHAWGGELHFVFLPDWRRYGQKRAGDLYRKEILKIAEELSIHSIDMATVFAEQEDPLELFPFRQSIHYNAAGYRLVAETVVNHVSP